MMETSFNDAPDIFGSPEKTFGFKSNDSNKQYFMKPGPKIKKSSKGYETTQSLE
jgi:exoribonuclease II